MANRKVLLTMQNYVLSCCSTADLTAEHFKKRDINYICFHFALDDKEYFDDLGATISYSDFYDALTNGAEPRTWQINAEEYIEYFTPFLKNGQDIVHLCISSGISGTYNSALIAKEELKKEFPEREIYIIDSLAASSGQGLFMDKLADLRDSGMSAKEVADWAIANRLRLHHWFFATDLTFFIKGGRISKTSGIVGTLLGICPLLNVNSEGKLIARQKVRTKRKVITEIVKKMEEHADGGLGYSDKCFISNSNCIEDAEAVSSLIKENFPSLTGDVIINSIGTTIGSHTGTGTVAVFFWGDERTE